MLSSEEELEETLVNNEYYGAIVIPKDFTLVNAAQQMKDQAADAAPEQALTQAQQAVAAQQAAAQAQVAGDVSAAQAAAAAQAGPGSEAAQQAQARQAQMQAIFAFGCQEIAFVCDLLLCMRLLRSYRIARPGEMRS